MCVCVVLILFILCDIVLLLFIDPVLLKEGIGIDDIIDTVLLK